jgi:uncharacterized protein (DUF983 family)
VQKYLKIVERCSACGESYDQLHVDDGASWMTILLVGIIIAPVLAMLEHFGNFSAWLEMTMLGLLACVLSLLLLPVSKGVLLALLWLTGAEGSERR